MVERGSLGRYFETLTVINLANRSDRRREAAQELERVGVSEPDVLFFEAISPTHRAGFDSVGLHGCFLSHLSVLKLLASKPGRRLHLVLEDDFQFSSDAINVLDELWSRIGDAELLLLGVSVIRESRYHSRETFSVHPGFEFVGSHAYAVIPATAQLMADYLQRMYARPPGHPDGGPMSPDGAIAWFRRSHASLNAKLIWPMICSQRRSRTDVHQLRWFDKFPIIRGGMLFVRKLLGSALRAN